MSDKILIVVTVACPLWKNKPYGQCPSRRCLLLVVGEYIEFLGGAGIDKSTIAADIYSRLKSKVYNIKLVVNMPSGFGLESALMNKELCRKKHRILEKIGKLRSYFYAIKNCKR